MRILIAFSWLLLLAPPALAAPPAKDLEDAHTKVEIWGDTRPQPRGIALFKSDMVRDHNAVRRRYAVPPLVWDETLAANALAYARRLAATQRFQHAPRRAGQRIEGENLWMGTRHAYAHRDMTGSWIEEGSDFMRGRFPNISRTGSWHDIGHFTQIIWGTTRAFGCGLAANAEDEYLVCRYFPAGNVWGEDPLAR